MASGWKVALGVAAGAFGAGVAVGIVAQRKGIPRDQVPRWVLKETTRRALHAMDAVRDLLPDEEPVRVDDLLDPSERP